MKDQYTGDINDFYKYGLLRALTSRGNIRCGVWWMKTPGDGRSDGSLTGYLSNPARYAVLDPELFCLMGTLVESGRRSVAEVERRGILPGAAFDGALVSRSPQARQSAFRQMLARFSACDMVFFDPDMGIETPSVRPGGPRASQYVYWSELVETLDRGHSALVFQYFPRRSRREFVMHTLGELASRVPSALVSCTWTPRVAFFLAATSMHGALGDSLDLFSGRWALPVLHERMANHGPRPRGRQETVAPTTGGVGAGLLQSRLTSSPRGGMVTDGALGIEESEETPRPHRPD